MTLAAPGGYGPVRHQRPRLSSKPWRCDASVLQRALPNRAAFHFPADRSVSQSDFGPPDGADVLLAVGELYYRRGAIIEGLRAYLSPVPREAALDALRVALIELRKQDDSRR